MPNINEYVKVTINTGFGKVEELLIVSFLDADGYFIGEITKGVFRGSRVIVHKNDIVQEKLMITSKEAREESLKNLPVALAKIEGFIKDKAAKGLTEMIVSNLWLNQDIIATLISRPYYYKVESVPGDAHKISW